MKKAVSAILIVFYFAVSSGVAINLHYCMNRFDSLQLGAVKSEVCGKCGMHTDDANGCCHDEVKIIKLQDDQQVSNIHFQFSSFIALADIVQPDFTEQLFCGISYSSGNNHSPPLNKQDTYLVNCVFRI
jgi:hypothetical protein